MNETFRDERRQAPLHRLFHHNTRLNARAGLPWWSVNRGSAASDRARTEAVWEACPPVELAPAPAGVPASQPLAQLLRNRRSRREFDPDRELRFGELSLLLQRAYSVTSQHEGVHAFRSAPSAGALYPIDLWVVSLRVSGLEPGVYRYEVERSLLRRVRTGDPRPALLRALAPPTVPWTEARAVEGIQEGFEVARKVVSGASAVIALSATFSRTTQKYGERGYRYVLFEAGHIGQNLYLTAEDLGFGAVAIGGFIDDELDGLLGLDALDRTSLYLMAVGPPAHPAGDSEAGAFGPEPEVKGRSEL